MKNNSTFRRALAVLLAAAMTFALTGCSVRELHIGQVEVNTGAGTAWITPARGVDRFDIPAADFSAGADGSVTYTGTAYRVLQGIDVSTFQQDIDWQAVADSGIAFAQLKDYAFWVSAPGTADDFYYAHDFWQYSYDGTVPGVSGSVDRDLWFVPITT